MNVSSNTSQKSKFFANFYHLWTYEGVDDVMEAVKTAAADAGMSLESVVLALHEVEDRKLEALAGIKNSPAVVWFKINATAIARFIEGSREYKGR